MRRKRKRSTDAAKNDAAQDESTLDASLTGGPPPPPAEEPFDVHLSPVTTAGAAGGPAPHAARGENEPPESAVKKLKGAHLPPPQFDAL